jgi:hypothetical protein
MKSFLWTVALLALGFFAAKYIRGKMTLVTPNAPSVGAGGAGTGVDMGGAKS